MFVFSSLVRFICHLLAWNFALWYDWQHAKLIYLRGFPTKIILCRQQYRRYYGGVGSGFRVVMCVRERELGLSVLVYIYFSLYFCVCFLLKIVITKTTTASLSSSSAFHDQYMTASKTPTRLHVHLTFNQTHWCKQWQWQAFQSFLTSVLYPGDQVRCCI